MLYMKNSKSISKSKKNPEVKDPVQNKNIIAINHGTTEEDIREKANEIYLHRVELGEEGTAETDWLEAEKYFSELED
jgi:hypothetical protein